MPKLITGDIPADGNPEDDHSLKPVFPMDEAPSVSMVHKFPNHVKAKRIAILVVDGMNDEVLTDLQKFLCEKDAMVQIIGIPQCFVKFRSCDQYPVDRSMFTASLA
ncbi:hypothetical protein [Chryseobacterium sp. MFBS3-17]|uniref:hypothetical protein n=1 Tax=Chryseobacterium sp. MFBS3-17 TaxID=2886689 RepID=UPI001D0DEFA4|nr:hypothetical protein [Chryseobacterium sp. MFBS3-17]MCC2590171.1 hypothetical protein [Chryseobacterium sp. MFBS3-17]